MAFERMRIFTGNANPSLAAKICGALGRTIGAASVEPFSDVTLPSRIDPRRCSNEERQAHRNRFPVP